MTGRGSEVLEVPAVDPTTSGRPRAERTARATRGLAAAGFSTFVALASHVLAGGEVPGLLGIVVPLVFATSACIALAGLRRSWLRLSVSVALSQVLFHTLFVVGAAGTSTVVAGTGGAHAGHGAEPMVMTVGSAGSSMAHAGHSGAWMWFAHAVAALVTVVTLRQGEAVLARFAELADRLVAVLFLPVVRLLVLPTHPRAALTDVEGVWTPSPLPVVTTGTVRRGPPVPSYV